MLWVSVCLRAGGSIPSISVGRLRVAPAYALPFPLESRRIVSRVANSSPQIETLEQMVHSTWCTSISVTPVDNTFKSFPYALRAGCTLSTEFANRPNATTLYDNAGYRTSSQWAVPHFYTNERTSVCLTEHPAISPVLNTCKWSTPTNCAGAIDFAAWLLASTRSSAITTTPFRFWVWPVRKWTSIWASWTCARSS
jgi:hypothetical protein